MRVVQSLQRGLAVLDYLADSTEPVRTSDIAAHFSIDKANASRLLNTLSAAGYARRTPDRRYAPGARFPGAEGRTLEALIDLRERTRSLLEGLVEASGECAHMAVLVADKVWYVDKISSPHPLRVDHPVGALAPLHCTALGKAYLAFGSRVASSDLARFTTHTITTLDGLAANLDAARREGFTRDDEEFSPGVRCVAAPIRNRSGAMMGAVGLSGPTARIDAARFDDLGRLVRDRAAELTPPTNGLDE
ncbi:MAG: IclR family transcriptional regulator [Hyphomicrobiales bacterium]|nr:IclR family transcriptional regulator [Hyphomicrobiales bacterium]